MRLNPQHDFTFSPAARIASHSVSSVYRRQCPSVSSTPENSFGSLGTSTTSFPPGFSVDARFLSAPTSSSMCSITLLQNAPSNSPPSAARRRSVSFVMSACSTVRFDRFPYCLRMRSM